MSFMAPLAALSALGWLGTMAAPMYLYSHTPWVLLAAPRPSFVLIAGHHVSTLLLLTIMTSRAMCAKPFNYMMGRRWGPKIATRLSRRSERAARRLAWLERGIDRWGVWAVLLRADGRVMNLVGARHLSPVKVGVASFVNALVHSILWLTAAPQLLRVGAATSDFWRSMGSSLSSYARTPAGAISSALSAAAVVVSIHLLQRRRQITPAIADASARLP
jgi:membrane protein DedA with SNARE-associated domain